MGYNTDFTGELKFEYDLTASELAKVKDFLGENPGDHLEWVTDKNFSYINLEFLDDFSGLSWNGGEKTRYMVEAVNIIINTMQKKYPDFGLTGEFAAQGEEFDDRWILSIDDDGFAYQRDVVIVGDKVKCPECDHEFICEKSDD